MSTAWRGDPARATRLDNAERVASSIPDNALKATGLREIAQAAAAADGPGRAARLFADAEQAAASITDERTKARTLAAIATTVAST
jgi:hypothetical protein